MNRQKRVAAYCRVSTQQEEQFDDDLIRQMLECVVVQSKEQIKIVFKDGTEVDQSLN